MQIKIASTIQTELGKERAKVIGLLSAWVESHLSQQNMREKLKSITGDKITDVEETQKCIEEMGMILR